MRVLWVCNTLPGIAAEAMGRAAGNKEGWLSGALKSLADKLCDRAGEDTGELTLAIAAPSSDMSAKGTDISGKRVSLIKGSDILIYEFYEDTVHPEIYDEGLEADFEHIIKEFAPDTVHVFGTEYGHCLAVSRVVSGINRQGSDIKLLIGLQGIISECAIRYTAGLPDDIVRSRTFRDIIKKDNIAMQALKFTLRGEHELEAIGYATDITGRTAFDRQWSEAHAPEAVYHHMNETLRPIFYEGTWDVTGCDRHVIFMSQGDYPLKGLHNVLSILPEIIERYPDTRLVVAGMNLMDVSGLKNRIRLSGYGRYLRELIRRYNLWEHVKFTGPLDPEGMKEQYLECGVYLCASSLENSPNSMGEAMLLSVPVVAPRVGGIPSMIEDGTEGMLYDRIEEIPDLICRLFGDDGLATELGAAGMNRALKTHDPKTNLTRLLEIYEEIR